MTHLPPDDDRQWREFLHRHRPTPPPAAPDLEARVMNTVEQSKPPFFARHLWALSPAIAAGFLMAWSGYRTLLPVSEPTYSKSIDAFLENNWNGVVAEPTPELASQDTTAAWMTLANSPQ